MLRVIAKRTGYCDGFGNLRVNKVSVTAFAASVDEARSFKVPYFRRSSAGITIWPFADTIALYMISQPALFLFLTLLQFGQCLGCAEPSKRQVSYLFQKVSILRNKDFDV